MQSVIEILSKTEEFFAQKGVPTPKLDAQLLLASVLKCKRLDLFLRFEDPLPKEMLDQYRELVRRRGKREPLQHILGEVEFFGLKLKSDRRALIPRNETEELCEILDARLPKEFESLNILDLGTGSGAIILSLKKSRPNASCTACDKDKDALSLARENALACSLEVNFIDSDWFNNIDGTFDLIVSNPPYLTVDEMQSAQTEVKNFDPIAALKSGSDGMDDLRSIIEVAPKFLNSNGVLALECGILHPAILKSENENNAAFKDIEILKDCSKRDRFLILTRA